LVHDAFTPPRCFDFRGAAQRRQFSLKLMPRQCFMFATQTRRMPTVFISAVYANAAADTPPRLPPASPPRSAAFSVISIRRFDESAEEYFLHIFAAQLARRDAFARASSSAFTPICFQPPCRCCRH
jgi:hypothetical protein